MNVSKTRGLGLEPFQSPLVMLLGNEHAVVELSDDPGKAVLELLADPGSLGIPGDPCTAPVELINNLRVLLDVP